MSEMKELLKKPIVYGSADLLKLASELWRSEFDKAAHALGWPDTSTVINGRGGRVKWKNPYRNYWCGGPNDEHWRMMITKGLAEKEEPQPGWIGENVYYTVTPLGMKVIRLRLRALYEARDR